MLAVVSHDALAAIALHKCESWVLLHIEVNVEQIIRGSTVWFFPRNGVLYAGAKYALIRMMGVE